MALAISPAAASAACDAIVDLVDGGVAAGTIEVRTGAAPAASTDADSGTLLATLTFTDPAFGAASSGVSTAATITSDTNTTSGTAAHFRVKDSTGTVIWQGTVGTTTGSDDIQFDNNVFTSGGTAAITSWTVTVPTT